MTAALYTRARSNALRRIVALIESATTRKAHVLDQARIAELSTFVETSMELSGVPGVSLGLYQNGHTVFAGGFGVRELGKLVAMELTEGMLPNGERYISRDALLARRAPQVVVGTDITYGMGLQVNAQYGTPVVHHGGDMIGFHSDMMWLPEHGVGAVILTNGDPGWLVRTIFRRKLLEVLFDGRAEADGQMAAAAKTFHDQLAAERKLLTVPADPAEAGKLAARYKHPAVGEIVMAREGSQTLFDFGEWSSEMATRKNPDGTISFITIVPGFSGLEFVAGERTLTLRDAQHEYVLKAQ